MNSRPRLICIPSGDRAFAERANTLFDEMSATFDTQPKRAAIEAFAHRLAVAFPTALVRERHPLADLGGDRGPVWYAIRRAYSSRIAATIDIPADREHVFKTYVERMPEWQIVVQLKPLATRSRRLANLEYEATYEFMGRELKGRLRIVDASPPRAVRVEATGMGVDVWYVTTFRSTKEGTRVEVSGEYNLPSRLIPPAVGRLVVERRIARDIEVAHAALRQICLGEDDVSLTSGPLTELAAANA